MLAELIIDRAQGTTRARASGEYLRSFVLKTFTCLLYILLLNVPRSKIAVTSGPLLFVTRSWIHMAQGTTKARASDEYWRNI